MTDPMTQAEFLRARGAKCPACRSSNIAADRPEVDGDVWVPVECEDCGATWNELHKLDGYADLKLKKPA